MGARSNGPDLRLRLRGDESHCRGRGAARLNTRTALIDAATASEVALAHALRTRLNAIPQDALEAMVNSANGLVGLVKLVEQIDSSEKSRWKRVADRLANPRNSCVHRGIEPSREEVQRAIEEAHAILETYSPLPKLN